MFVEDYKPSQVLPDSKCPRCYADGLWVIGDDIYDAAPPKDRHQAKFVMCPSLYCQCVVCGLVAEWPTCRSEDV